jgi:hypothetical protein
MSHIILDWNDLFPKLSGYRLLFSYTTYNFKIMSYVNGGISIVPILEVCTH